MKPIQISREEYRDKVFACWLGKNIGGTLGMPYECNKAKQALTFYDPLPQENAPNDDLDMQIVWLQMMRDNDVYPTLTQFSDYWIEHLSPYPWCEYGFCRRNFERGLRPPMSGAFENYFIDEMGSPIRSEIWACVAPGDPQLAAALSWNDAILDHAGGEGVYGEMFWAAIESAAFVISDPRVLIQIGLDMIPLWSRISRVVREVIWCRDNDICWDEARERVLKGFGHDSPCHAPQNHGFTIMGWLYGEDFGDKLCKAVNCGYDTDCSGATLGSVLGIIGGTAAIPAEWRDPIGDTIVLHKFTANLDCAKNVGELTDHTVEIAEKMLVERSDVSSFGDSTVLPENALSLLSRNEKALLALTRDPLSTIITQDGYDLALHYNGEPVLRPGVEKIVGVSVRKDDRPVAAAVQLTAPEGWSVEALDDLLGQKRFKLFGLTVPDHNDLIVTATAGGKSLSGSFRMLGPGEAKGYPVRTNVPTCPECHARVEACVCRS
ncbi:MAG: ADP-ribosylglycohydrolase family protein [Armatimonadota bacterium]